MGGAILTDYDFKYILPDIDFRTGENQQLEFKVDGDRKTPSSNIHVLIGNNSYPKTFWEAGYIWHISFAPHPHFWRLLGQYMYKEADSRGI